MGGGQSPGSASQGGEKELPDLPTVQKSPLLPSRPLSAGSWSAISGRTDASIGEGLSPSPPKPPTGSTPGSRPEKGFGLRPALPGAWPDSARAPGRASEPESAASSPPRMSALGGAPSGSVPTSGLGPGGVEGLSGPGIPRPRSWEGGSARPPEVPLPPQASVPILPTESPGPSSGRRVRGTRLAIVLLIVGGLVVGVVLVVMALVRGARTGSSLPSPSPESALVGATTPDPADALDEDGDGLLGADERRLGTDLRQPDTDGDGLADGDEISLGTDPLNGDTDGDGFFDGKEVKNCYDPRIASPGDKIQACPPFPGL